MTWRRVRRPSPIAEPASCSPSRFVSNAELK
jgi:hypothetical protein